MTTANSQVGAARAATKVGGQTTAHSCFEGAERDHTLATICPQLQIPPVIYGGVIQQFGVHRNH